MKGKGIVAATTFQRKPSTGFTFTEALCLFAPLVTFLALLGWATWEMRLANPMAFEMFAGLIVVVLVLAIVNVLPRPSDGLRSAPGIAAKQFDLLYEMAPLTSLTVAALEHKNRKP